jgi:hypothetical protein
VRKVDSSHRIDVLNSKSHEAEYVRGSVGDSVEVISCTGGSPLTDIAEG